MKNKRQQVLLALIKERVFLTQEDLQKGLVEKGFPVTQSTVSRDIKDLRIGKAHDSNGVYRYVAADMRVKNPDQAHFRELFAQAAKSVAYALNNVVVKCDTGMAQSACVAIDELYGEMMLGSLAGEDTIIIVTESEADSRVLAQELKYMIPF